MYCDKLKSIYQHEDASKYGINIDIIKKLDFFIKEKTTILERKNINPIKYAIEMTVNEKTSIMLFVIGAKCNLFKLRAFIECECGDRHELTSVDSIIECNCERDINPLACKEKVYLYFRLLESPTECKWLEVREYPIDYISDDLLGKRSVSLAEVEEITGAGILNELVGQRDMKYKNFLGVHYD